MHYTKLLPFLISMGAAFDFLVPNPDTKWDFSTAKTIKWTPSSGDTPFVSLILTGELFESREHCINVLSLNVQRIQCTTNAKDLSITKSGYGQNPFVLNALSVCESDADSSCRSSTDGANFRITLGDNVKATEGTYTTTPNPSVTAGTSYKVIVLKGDGSGSTLAESSQFTVANGANEDGASTGTDSPSSFTSGASRTASTTTGSTSTDEATTTESSSSSSSSKTSAQAATTASSTSSAAANSGTAQAASSSEGGAGRLAGSMFALLACSGAMAALL